MPQKDKDSAPWWWFVLDILIGLGAGHFWAISHVASNDGARDQSFTSTVALAIVGGIAMGAFTIKLRKYGLTALCTAIVAFGVGAWFL